MSRTHPHSLYRKTVRIPVIDECDQALVAYLEELDAPGMNRSQEFLRSAARNEYVSRAIAQFIEGRAPMRDPRLLDAIEAWVKARRAEEAQL